MQRRKGPPASPGLFRLPGPLYCRLNCCGCLLRTGPSYYFDPFSLFEIFVMAKEMGYLVTQYRGQVFVRAHAAEVWIKLVDRHCDYFLVGSCFVLHNQHPHWTGADHRPGENRGLRDDQNVDRVTVRSKRVRNESI